jgi:KDO2-lipid IV(A) lauroyltransferase
MEILGHGTPRIIDALVERARAGAVVALVADRDLSRRGIEVEFFGERTRMPAGPGLVALGAGVPLFPATLTLDDDWGWSIQLHEAVVAPPDAADPVAAMVQGTARAFEQGIREKPQDWHMLQPLWLADLDPRRAPAAGSGNATAGDTQGTTGGGADDAEGKGSRG